MALHEKTVDKYLLVKAKGGMGNRMLCAVTGILYGQLTGREAVVDWRDESYSNDGTNAFPKFFSCPKVYSVALLPEHGSVRPSIWANELHKSMDCMIRERDTGKHSSILIHRKYSVNIRRLEYDEDILIFWYYTQQIPALRRHLDNPKHGFVGLTTSQIISKLLHEKFTLDEGVRQRIADFKARYWQQPVIGLHVRYTDKKTNLACYERSLQRFLQREPNARIFLATDNGQISRYYHDRYKNVLSTPKWFPDDCSAMHQNYSCPDRVLNGIEALVDMYLLSDCDYLIYPGSSTFSWVSRLLSTLPAEKAVDIERFNPKVRLKRWIRELVA